MNIDPAFEYRQHAAVPVNPACSAFSLAVNWVVGRNVSTQTVSPACGSGQLRNLG